MPAGPQSRYQFCNTETDADGNVFLTTPEPYRYVYFDDNIQYVCASGDTLWGLAGQYYGSLDRASELYWIILDFNDIVDPTIALEAGQEIWIPSLRTVTEEILSEKRRLAFQE